VSGDHNPRNAEIADWIGKQSQGRVVLEINPHSVAPLFADCDLAIMAGGPTIYEAACCGLPMILIVIAENQLSQARAWGERAFVKFLGFKKDLYSEELLNAFFGFYNNNKKLHEISRSNEFPLDSQGSTRVCDNIMNLSRKV